MGGASPGSKCMRGQGGSFISEWGQLHFQMACVDLAEFLEKRGDPDATLPASPEAVRCECKPMAGPQLAVGLGDKTVWP